MRIGDNKGARYASDNFWMMGDTGPCGPCSEIFYDHGPEIAGGPPGSPDEDGDRYIEIWNNVFMQFNRDEAGVMHKLPKPSVDTGMGLERLTAVLQHVHSNYEIDLFVDLLAAAKRAVDAAGAGDCDAESPSLKVIADHIRACTFTVVDGVIPGNEGRGYVLRRITRRAIRHGYKLGARKPFFHKLVADLVGRDGRRLSRSCAASRQRVDRRAEAGGGALLPDHRQRHGDPRGGARRAGGRAARMLDGDVAFKLHDTYGFPLDLTADVCRERGVAVDDGAASRRAMARQREQARARRQVQDGAGARIQRRARPPSTATSSWRTTARAVAALYVDGSAGRASRAPATTPSSCSTTRRSTPRAAARSATPASCATRPRAFVVEDTMKIQAGGVRPPGPRRRGRDQGRRRARRPGRRRARAPRPCATTARPT